MNTIKKLKGICIGFLFALVLISCNKDDEESSVIISIWVAPETVKGCVPPSEIEIDLLQIKEERGDWFILYQSITGFEYEAGYEYLIKVQKTKVNNPPEDHPSVVYSLIEVISKTEKKQANNGL